MFFIDDEEFTRHGYYLINGIKTLSKFEAWQFSKGKFEDIKFIFNDNVMDQYDWSVEPEEDIYNLYRQRAEQLRNDYDYIVLMYSGGVDSHNILETFLHNNIKIDEICTFSNADVELKTKKFNQEVFNKAIPFLSTLDFKKIGTKFRYIEIGQYVIDQWSDEFNFENFEHFLHGPQWWVIRSHILKNSIDDHIKINNLGKKICYVWGLDKPDIRIENNNYCLFFVDNRIDFGIREFITKTMFDKKFLNFYDEPFYISKNCPKISIKQAHLLLNLIKKIDDSDPSLKTIFQLPNTGPFIAHHKNLNGDYKFLSKEMVNKSIYPNLIISKFGDDKIYGSMLLTKKDAWFSLSEHTNKIKWIQKLSKLVKNNNDYYRVVNEKLMATKRVESKPYYITKSEVL